MAKDKRKDSHRLAGRQVDDCVAPGPSAPVDQRWQMGNEALRLRGGKRLLDRLLGRRIQWIPRAAIEGIPVSKPGAGADLNPVFEIDLPEARLFGPPEQVTFVEVGKWMTVRPARIDLLYPGRKV